MKLIIFLFTFLPSFFSVHLKLRNLIDPFKELGIPDFQTELKESLNSKKKFVPAPNTSRNEEKSKTLKGSEKASSGKIF